MGADHVHLLELALEGASAHAEEFSGHGAVVSAALKGGEDELMLGLFDIEITFGLRSGFLAPAAAKAQFG